MQTLEKEKLFPYLMLFAGLIFGFFLFCYYSYDRKIGLYIGIIMSLYYFLWGLIYHQVKKDLTIKILAEYLLISLLAVIILFFVLNRA